MCGGDFMKNQIYRLVAVLGISLGLAAAAVQAQTPTKVEIKIPFAFSAGKTTLQPGLYSIARMSGNILTMRSADGSSAVILNALPVAGAEDKNKPERLVFYKQGEQYFLAQIWLSADTGRRVATGRKLDNSERIEIALRRR